jgi:penicillin amidase
LLAVGACSDPEDETVNPDAGSDVAGELDADQDGAGDSDASSGDVFANLRRPTTVITDEYGMRHIYAESLEDLFFMNGFMYATDRFAQMEFYRRVATGTLGELLGGLSSSAVETDVLMRTLGLKRSAKAFVEQNYDPDNQSYQALDSFCEGVNAYIAKYRRGEVSPPSAMAQVMPASAIRDWEPADVLAVGKLLAVQLTYTAPLWIDAHNTRQAILDTFVSDASDPAMASRAGFLADVLRTAPATDATHIDGFPAGGTNALNLPNQSDSKAPRISRDVLESALTLHDGLTGLPGFPDMDLFGRHNAFERGSNNWVLSGDLTASGHPNVANDPHLGLSLPTSFYPIHLELNDDIDGREPLKMVGAGILGVPGIVVGRTDKVAWGTTVGYYDYVDVYHENITGSSDGANPATVEFGGDQVEVERITETIGIGAFGDVTDEVDLTLEVVPHHGPILPPTESGLPVARTGSEGLSIKWVGLEANNEFDFLMGLWRAETPADVEEALDYYTVGSSNFVFGFSSGETFYSGQSNIPIRQDGALNYDPVDNPGGNAPIFVLPSDGTAEWDGFLSDEFIPHVYNRPEGYVVTANNDQVGATLDNNPFDEAPYLGGFYDIGFRAERITERITNATGERPADEKISLEQQIDIQNDGFDKVAERVVPHMVTAIDRALDETIDATDDPELQTLRADIAGRETTLAELRTLLSEWDFESPATREPTGDDIDRSAAASLFNASMVFLLPEVYADELSEVGLYSNGRFTLPSSTQVLIRSLVHLLDETEQTQTYDASVGDSIIFDDMATEMTETRQTSLVRALLAGRDRLASGQNLAEVWGREIPSPGSGDPTDWVWGEMHGLRLDGLVPFAQAPFQRPSSERGLPFYERPGGQFAVSPCDHGYNNFNFTCTSGSSLRMVHDMDPSGPTTFNAVPGGYSGDPSSPYFDSEVEMWNRAEPRKLEDDRATLEQNADDVTVYGGP